MRLHLIWCSVDFHNETTHQNIDWHNQPSAQIISSCVCVCVFLYTSFLLSFPSLLNYFSTVFSIQLYFYQSCTLITHLSVLMHVLLLQSLSFLFFIAHVAAFPPLFLSYLYFAPFCLFHFPFYLTSPFSPPLICSFFLCFFLLCSWHSLFFSSSPPPSILWCESLYGDTLFHIIIRHGDHIDSGDDDDVGLVTMETLSLCLFSVNFQ